VGPEVTTGGRAGAPVLVVALGGNAITRPGDEPSVQAQFTRTRETVEHLLGVVGGEAWRVVVTHGNGPQVGNVLLRSDLAAEAGVLPRLPVATSVADTQGGMGYMIQQCLANALRDRGMRVTVATVVTQVVVARDDPAFDNPSKPIGRFYPQEKVDELRGHGWTMNPDPAGQGWRRVVPSPAPREIVEEPVIRELLDDGVIVIACGGGGIPVVTDGAGSLQGVDAVVDKDLASSLLATAIGASAFAILTDVDQVCLDFGRPSQRALADIDVASLSRYAVAGHFPPGSMGPKVEAVIGFLRRGGRGAIITSAGRLDDALAGRAGTRVVPSQGVEAPAAS
jgi:carbamate kinase